MGKAGDFFRKAAGTVFDNLFPDGIKCAACDRELPDSPPHGLCDACRDKIELNLKYCLCCGRSLPDLADYCQSCKREPPAFDKARSALIYSGLCRELIISFKNGNRWLSPHLAFFLAQRYPFAAEQPDIITFVPIEKRRQRERGFNQAGELARLLSAEKNIPHGELLIKLRETKKQSLLPAAERAENVRGAYAIAGETKLSGQTILLIDDILTTGGTASECARILKKAGASAVLVYTLAAVPTV